MTEARHDDDDDEASKKEGRLLPWSKQRSLPTVTQQHSMKTFESKKNLLLASALFMFRILKSARAFQTTGCWTRSTSSPQSRTLDHLWIVPRVVARKTTAAAWLLPIIDDAAAGRGSRRTSFSSSPWWHSTTSLLASASSPTTTPPQPASASASSSSSQQLPLLVNLSTVSLAELETLVMGWGHPKYRAGQVWHWIRVQGITDVTQMTNVPQNLREQLLQCTRPSSLQLASEQISKDGTIKRAYQCHDKQLIESVLMPYDDGRFTACISSQAGCAQGCVFCATGQMGFARQLTCDEIFEQVSRFAELLLQRNQRLSNVVFMGMGEPLANYKHVMNAVRRINDDLGIGARKITLSTVGIVPNIQKLYQDPTVPQVRLAVSLHCATDDERTALLPANRRNGGLDALMTTLREYIEVTGRRLTLEWALIHGDNDTPESARSLGRLLRQHRLRRDMVHVNVIPLNPTGGYVGAPSQRSRVDAFCKILQTDYGVTCTPRMRRGIDIDAGCGQLKAKVLQGRGNVESLSSSGRLGVYDGQGHDEPHAGGPVLDDEMEVLASSLREDFQKGKI